jgi:hypothetical protein
VISEIEGGKSISMMGRKATSVGQNGAKRVMNDKPIQGISFLTGPRGFPVKYSGEPQKGFLRVPGSLHNPGRAKASGQSEENRPGPIGKKKYSLFPLK